MLITTAAIESAIGAMGQVAIPVNLVVALQSDDLATVEQAMIGLQQQSASDALFLSITVYRLVKNQVYKPTYQFLAHYFFDAPGRLQMIRQ